MRFFIGFILLNLITGCTMSSWPESIESGFEEFRVSGDSLMIVIDENEFYSQATIDSVSFEGKYCLFAAHSGVIAIEIPIQDPKPDSKYLITCWRKGSGTENLGSIVVLDRQPDGLKVLEIESNPAIIKNDWQMLELLVQLPPNYKGSELLVRLENKGDEPVWFDDFKIEFLDKVYYPEFNDDEVLSINVTEPDLERLREKRLEAFENGFIEVGKDDWINAEVLWRDTILAARLRFKGDNLKHLQGDKWSFTIDIENGSVMGMGRFAIQTPEARNFLDEWLFHKVLQQEGLATSKYTFAPVSLNERSLGAYAIVEDQRDEEFLARVGNGVVLRFEDNVYWKNKLSASPKSDGEILLESKIESIASLGLEKSTIEKFEIDIQTFRLMEDNVASLFDNDQTAKLLAVCDVLKSYNALHWVNVRFYGNAKSGNLEFIGHDGFSTANIFNFGDKPFIAYSPDSIVEASERWNSMYYNLFNDREFTDNYINQLDRISQEQYFNLLKLNIIGEMKYHQSLLLKEWPSYRFKYSDFYKHARLIRKRLEPFQLRIEEQPVKYVYTASQGT